MTEQVTETQALPPMFTTLDRCDRCGAQAKTRALLPGGFLLFCGHHTKKYTAGLEKAGALLEFDLNG
jgi:hypothetical protein